MTDSHSVLDQAIAWHLRLPELTGADWAAFVAWLEQSADHRAAFDEVTAADALVGPGLGADGAAVSVDGAPSRNGRAMFARPGLRWALAAAVCLALTGGWVLRFGEAPLAWMASGAVQTERTRPGTTKELAFADGARIDLNGDTALAFDTADQRAVRLEHGEARFAVSHGARPFTVQAAGFVLRDLGTVFNVRVDAQVLRLDVSEGKVLFDPDGANLLVSAGEQITVDRSRNLVVKQVAQSVGDWRNGVFAFDNARLADLTQAVYRRYGWRIMLGEGLADRPFTGTVRLSGQAGVDVPHLAGLIGVHYRREGESWLIDSADRAR